MIFDVIIREGINEVGKDVLNVYRIHDKILSSYLRKVQNEGKYIISVIPLFRQKREQQSNEEINTEKETLEEIIEYNREVIYNPYSDT